MSKYIIQGGAPLIGKVKLSGAKNAGFKQMIASLMTDEVVNISNTPSVRDVGVLKEIITDLGGQVKVGNSQRVTLSGKGLRSFELDPKYGSSARVSSMLVGPLLHRFKKAAFPRPGGDRIGDRPIDRHIDGLMAMGAKIEEVGEYFVVSARKLKGTHYRFSKSTHTGTETLVMCAVLANGKTVLENAAAEPEVDDLIKLLNSMGAKVSRTKKRTIEIEGVSELHGAEHTVMPDRNEAVTYGCMALGTKGDIFITDAREEDLKAFIQKVTEANGGVEVKSNGVRFFTKGPLRATYVETEIHPGFMTDWQSLWVTLMTQAEGTSEVIERVFENRFAYVANLAAMGAQIELHNPKIKEPETFYEFNTLKKDPYLHAAKITGPSLLGPINAEVSDIRAGATLVLAALIARGKTELSNIEHIERGYENLEYKLRELGAKIYKV